MNMRLGAVALVLVLMVALAGSPAPAAGVSVVTRIAVTQLPGRLQLGIEATGPVTFRTFTLGDPDRVVVDVRGATDGLSRDVILVHQGPVLQIRVSKFTDHPPTVRVVVDLNRPVAADVAMSAPAVVTIGFDVSGGAGAVRGPNAGAGLTQADTGHQPMGPKAGSAASVGGSSQSGTAPRGLAAGPAGIEVAQTGGPGPGGITLNLDLRDADLPGVLDALARLCAMNIVTDSSVTGKVTIHLVGVTCQQAFTFLLEANGLGSRRLGSTMIVQAASKLAPPPPGPVVQVYRLQYLQPPITTPEPLVGTVGATSAGGAGVAGGQGPVPKNVGALTALFQGTGATVGYDDRTNSLVVTGTPDQQAAVQALLRQLDVPIGQVVVQALIVDITAKSLLDLGIEWSIVSGGQSNPIEFSEVPQPPPGVMTIQQIQRDALFAKLHAFAQEGHAKILTSPRLATPDGQEALLFAGDQLPIVNTTTAGEPPVTTETVTFQPVGVTLKIVPKVNADRTITVQIHPVVTVATSFTPATPQNPQGLPIISIREAVTSLQVPDGGTIVIGGLISSSDIVTLTKVPFFGDLPFFGAFFRFTNTNHQEGEVIIIMTPTILSSPTPAG